MRFSLLSSQLPALVRPSNTDSRFSSPTTLASERSNTSRPLNCVVRPVRSISCASRVTSAWMAWRSDALLVSLAACTASSRMRCRLAVTLCSAPSAVCMSDRPSLALRTAWFSPRICEVKRSEIARPAASSLALLMRRPEDRRCTVVAISLCALPSRRCAFSDITLVLIVNPTACPVNPW